MRRGIIDAPSQAGKRPFLARAGLFLNIFWSIMTTALLKYAFFHFDFPNLTASLIHFVVGQISVHVLARKGFFPVVRIMWKYALLFSLGFCAMVTFADFSLRYNTLGTFLILKITTLFWIPLVHIFWFGYSYSGKTLLALSPVLIGSVIHLYFDNYWNWRGIMCGLFSAIVTAVYQVYVSQKQQEIQVNALQLLYYEAPMSGALLIPFALYFDSSDVMISIDTSKYALCFVFLSAVVWSAAQVSTNWIIGHTTCTEYNILSQTKFALTVILGYCMFDSNVVTFPQIAGDVLTLCGIILYTHLKLVDSMKDSIRRADRVVFSTQRV